MITEKRNTFRLLFFIRKAKLQKNGEAPIYLRITLNGRIMEMMIKRTILVNLWSQTKERSKGVDRKSLELNNYIESIRARIYLIHKDLSSSGQVIDIEDVRKKFYGIEEDNKTLIQVYQKHNDKCELLIGKDYSKSTVDKFKTSIQHLKEYILFQYKTNDILLSDVDGEFIREFDFYLKTQKACQQNTVVKHLKNLKKVIRIAISNDWISKDPFLGIQFKQEETQVDFLTQEELYCLIQKEFTIKRIEEVRDVFVFCCFTGMAFSDVKNLREEHLIKDNQGNLWIRKQREKTGIMCNIPVLTSAKAILDKYRDHPKCVGNSQLLPVVSNQRANAYLKEIADLCNINKRLTTHCARYTCATVVMLANNVSMENVAKILGHANTKITHRYAKVLDSSIMRDMKAVEANFGRIV